MQDYCCLTQLEITEMQKFASQHSHSNVFVLRHGGDSGIGTNIYISCGKCQEEKDVTDYGSW